MGGWVVSDEIKTLAALISLIVGVIAILTAAVTRDRNISKRISDGNGKTHDRIDKLNDDIRDNFARKADVHNDHQRVERAVENLGVEMRKNHQTLMHLLVKNSE